MSDLSGERAWISTTNADALQTRLESLGVRFEFVPHGDVVEVRYEATAAARQYVAEYRLPPVIEGRA